jgi:predicted ATP-dependent endonuclease of OLD family
MRIHRVEILNFRSFVTFELELAGRSVLVIGENAGGKTSLLTAIARALGRDLSFSKADFADPTLAIQLRVTLTDLDTPHRAMFGNHVDFGAGGPSLVVETRAIWNAAAEEAEVEHRYPRTEQRSRRPFHCNGFPPVGTHRERCSLA